MGLIPVSFFIIVREIISASSFYFKKKLHAISTLDAFNHC